MTYVFCADNLGAMSRLYRFTFKLVATIFGVLALLVMIVSWRVATLASSSTDVAPTIKSAFSAFAPRLKVEMGKTILTWNKDKQTLSLSSQELDIRDQQNQPVASLQSMTLQLRLWGLLRGRIVPQELSGEKIRLWLRRDKTGQFYVLGHTENNATKKKLYNKIDFLFLQFIADELGNPYLRHTINVNDIKVLVQDEKDGQDWFIKIPELTLNHHEYESKGDAKLELVEADRTSSLQASYDFNFDKKLHGITLKFQEIKLAAFAAHKLNLEWLRVADFPLSGQVMFRTDRDLNVSDASIKIEGGKGFLSDSVLWDHPRAIEKLSFEAVYDKSKDTLLVPVAQIDFGGPKLSLTLQAKTPTPKDLIWLNNRLDANAFTIHITLDDLPMNEYGSVWPKSIIPDARSWIVSSLRKGVFTHGEVTIKGKAKLDDLKNITLESGGGFITAKDAEVHYLKDMPIIENAQAKATFDLEHMEVNILTGNTGEIKLRPFTLVIDNFQQDIQNITIPIELEGPANEVLTVLDAPPLGYAKETGLDPKDSVGHVAGTLILQMPLLDDLLLKDVEVKAKAQITGFGAKKLVPQIGISNGDFALDLTKEGFDLKGRSDLNGVSSQIMWKSNFGLDEKSALPVHDAMITTEVKGDEWGRFYGLDRLAKVQGPTFVTIKYKNLRDGFSQVFGKVDLQQAQVQLKDIGWNKSAGVAAQLGFDIDVGRGKNLMFKSITINGPSIHVKGKAELEEDSGKLVSLTFDSFVLGRSNAKISYFDPVDFAKPIVIKVTGESFDLDRVKETKEKTETETPTLAVADTVTESNRPRDYTLKLGKLYTSSNGFLSNVSAHVMRDSLGWKEMDVYGLAQGTVPVNIQLAQQDDGLSFQLGSDDFGKALQGLGFGDGVSGGVIEIIGKSVKEYPRTIQGKIKIGSFVVSDLPILARLLSAVSPFGFLDLITGNANFDHLDGNYLWSGNNIDFSDVRVAGSVVGINLDGRMNTETAQASINGTMVPFSFVNSIIGSIPLLGDVITGGNGQGVIAASFTIKGDLSNPAISVNPVSLLTPGFLRNLFFPGDDTKSEDKKR